MEPTKPPGKRGRKPRPEIKPPIPDPAWSRAEGEINKAFHAFKIYRDLGSVRTLYRVQQKLVDEGLSNHRGGRNSSMSIRDWSVFYSWSERAALWDAHLDARRALARADYTEKWERRRLENLEKTWELAGTV